MDDIGPLAICILISWEPSNLWKSPWRICEAHTPADEVPDQIRLLLRNGYLQIELLATTFLAYNQ